MFSDGTHVCLISAVAFCKVHAETERHLHTSSSHTPHPYTATSQKEAGGTSPVGSGGGLTVTVVWVLMAHSTRGHLHFVYQVVVLLTFSLRLKLLLTRL